MNGIGDHTRERLASRSRWKAAMLVGTLSAMVALGGTAAAAIPGVGVAMRVVSGALPVVGAAAGVRAAVRDDRSRSGELLVPALAGALRSTAALVALRSATRAAA
jgi:hypothetical protein